MNRSPREQHETPAKRGFHGDGGNRTHATFPPSTTLETPRLQVESGAQQSAPRRWSARGHGTGGTAPMHDDPIQRFWAKVDRRGESECWIWLRAINAKGYGTFSGASDTTVLAHRIAYELLVGPIPEDRQLHHVCEQPACVNPTHLRPVTPLEHRREHKQTQCRNGHPRTAENVRFKPNGNLVCVPCKRAADVARLRRLRGES